MSLKVAVRSGQALTETEKAILEEAIASSLSANTAAMYRHAWRRFVRWCSDRGSDPMEATPELLSLHLASLAESGLGPSSWGLARAAVRKALSLTGKSVPTGEPVGQTLRGLRRQWLDAGGQPRQALPIGEGELAAIAATSGPVDVALAHVLSSCALRRSEAAALTWDAVRKLDDGSGRIAVRRSKTDQEGEGAVVYVPPAAMAALDGLTREREFIFGISPSQINRRVKAACTRAGLGDGYTSHSGRVGTATRMAARGAPMAVVMRQGRWRTERMVAHYTRSEIAGEAGRYLD